MERVALENMWAGGTDRSVGASLGTRAAACTPTALDVKYRKLHVADRRSRKWVTKPLPNAVCLSCNNGVKRGEKSP